MLLSNWHLKFIFLLALAVGDSGLGLIFFRFHSGCFFHDARKFKIWWGNRENMQDLFGRISDSGK